MGGQPVWMQAGKATLADGTLAGSSIHLMDAVRNVVRFWSSAGAGDSGSDTDTGDPSGLARRSDVSDEEPERIC